MTLGVLIVVSIVCIVAIICLTLIVYNQLLAGNEINRRLIVITQESIEHDRMTCEDLRNALQDFDSKMPPVSDIESDNYTFPEGMDPDEL
jgi:hypothetical protein